MIRRRLHKWRSRIFWDRAGDRSTVFVAGMGRSGTTWAADLLNYDGASRIMFEPFDSRRVKQARAFRYVQYMNHESPDRALIESARTILRGGVRNRWVDLDNRRFVLRHRIIKEVRCNLMLRWLKTVCPEMSVVLMIRHPLSVALSWLKLGWGSEREGSDFQIITTQRALLADFPVVGDALKHIDAEDAFERIVFQWCVLHLVPLTQFGSSGLTLLFYEDLVRDPQRRIEGLFREVGRTCQWARLSPLLEAPSRTNFLQRDIGATRDELLSAWQRTFTAAQIRRAQDILEMFGLERSYLNGYPSEPILTTSLV